MSGETASLIVEFKSAGAETVKREAEAVKVSAIKSARESAAVFVQAYKERDQAAIEWMQRLKERDAALLVQQKQAGASARAEIKAQQAQQLAELRANQAERLSEIKAAARKEADAIRAARRDASLGQRDAQVVAYNKAMALRDTGMGPRDSHVDVWKAVQAEKVALAKAAAIAERRELAATRVAERQAAAERKQEAREVERARIQAAREAARQERASAASGAKGFKVGIGAVAGQGFSVGGIASVNPYAAAGVAAAYMVKNVATDLVREATVWEKFKVALTDIEGSAAKAKETTNDLYELAKRPGIGLKEAEQTYIQFRALSMEGEKAQKVIKAVSNAVALSGGGAVEFQRVNYQITQMLSKGKVLEEDLRIMRNSLPRLTVAMRDAFGTTTAEGIRKAGVNAEQFLDKIVAQFEKLPAASQTLESTLENAATAQSRFKASLVNTDYVKEKLAGWTGLLESMTKIVEGESVKWGELLKSAFTQGPGAAINDFAAGAFTQTPEQVRAMEMYEKQMQLNKLRQGGDAKQFARNDKGELYSISLQDKIEMLREELEAYGREVRMAQVNKFIAGLPSLKDQKSAATDPAADKEAQKAAEKAAREKERELANLKQIALENEKLRISLSANTEFEKERLILVAEYSDKIRNAATEREKAALREQMDLQLSILHVKNRTELEKEQAKVIEERAEIAKKALKDLADIQKKQDEDRQASNKAKIQSGNDLTFKFAPEGEKLAIEYEKNRQLIVDATFKTGEERNRVMKALNDQYVRDQAQMLTESAMTVTSAGQSLFGDLASSYKMGVDYRYDLEKAAINKTLSLTGLEGAARVAQQQKRDDALQSLDEKRQAQMEGTYMTMFMISKGFALAESVLKLNLAIAQAAASGPFPANLAAMAAVAASVGSVVSNIAAINYAGAYDKGGDIPAGQVGMVGENGWELVTGPAHVTSTKDTAKLLAGAGTAPVVNVMNYSGQNVQVQQGTDPGTIDIIVGEVSKRVEGNLATSIRSGRGEVQSAIKETYALTRSGY